MSGTVENATRDYVVVNLGMPLSRTIFDPMSPGWAGFVSLPSATTWAGMSDIVVGHNGDLPVQVEGFGCG
jgi:hypothetical protein